MEMNIYKLLELEEGLRYKSYPDPISETGLPYTIGVGHTGPEVIPGLEWTKPQIISVLYNDVYKCILFAVTNCAPWFPKLSPIRQAVVLSMIFQLGQGRFTGFKKFLSAVANQDYKTAALEMKDSRWYKQTPARVDRLASQLIEDIWVPNI